MRQRRRIVSVQRIAPLLAPDRSRVLLRPFFPANLERARRIVDQVLSMPEKAVRRLLEEVLGDFSDRHEHLQERFLNRFRAVRSVLAGSMVPSTDHQTLVGAYFSMEYSVESTALFNPSIVPHPDQTGLPEGALRFILSLRAIGEGHISSLAFRTGIVNTQNRVILVPPARFVSEPEPLPQTASRKSLLSRKLQDSGVLSLLSRRTEDLIPETFSLEALRRVLESEKRKRNPADKGADRRAQDILDMAEADHEVTFDPQSDISQRVLFPFTHTQSKGIEDARFVHFRSEGAPTYYATYTAYDGVTARPQLLETQDFVRFRFLTLKGAGVQNKGMALFPRKIQGRYAMLSRQDDENLFLMYSDDLHRWEDPRILLGPSQPWDLVKIGTCGSPIETKAGWLVLSHGVGPMRKYCLGALLLDLADPSIVRGRLADPLLAPNEAEREGYVPNVIYTCGALVHGPELLIPYGASDYSTSFATVDLDDLLEAME